MRGVIFVALCCATASAAAVADLNDYRRGIELDVKDRKPLVELDVPDLVYQTVVRPDLGDVRVFNADGQPVPHTLCIARVWSEPAIETRTLPVFELNAGAKRTASGARIEVETPAGSRVHINDSAPKVQNTKVVRAHVIDAHEVERDLRAIAVHWQSSDGASEVKVRVEASNDLDVWREVVGASTLLEAKSEAGELQRQRVPLPQGRYKYLRLERADGGPALQVSSVVAEVVLPIERVEPHWFTAVVKPAPPTQGKEGAPQGIEFDSQRQSPVNYGRIKFGTDNVSVHAQLLSRVTTSAPWHSRWDGESYSIVTEGTHRESPPVELGLTTDRYWQLKTNDLPALQAARPSLELGYYPARLRFLAQGNPPYTLAFGSERAEPAASSGCGTLLANLTANDAAQLTAAAQIGATRELGGEEVLRPRPRSTPTRLIVLWATLFFGAVIVALMAMSLMRRVRKPE